MKPHLLRLSLGVLLVAAGCTSPGDSDDSLSTSTVATRSSQCGSTWSRSIIGRLHPEEGSTVDDIAASRQHPDVLWVVGRDDAGRPQAAAMSIEGGVLSTVDLGIWLDGVTDVAVGPGPDPQREYLYLTDLAPERSDGDTVVLARIEAPLPGQGASQAGVETYRLHLPAGSPRPSALVVEPTSGDIVLLATGLFEVSVLHAAAPLSTDDPILLHVRATLDPTLADGFNDAAIRSDGDLFAISRFGALSLWLRPPNASLAEAVTQPACVGSPHRNEGLLLVFGADRSRLLAIDDESLQVYEYQLPSATETASAGSNTRRGNLAPRLAIVSPPPSTQWQVGEAVQLQAAVQDDQAIDDATVVWKLIQYLCLHDESCAPETIADARGALTTMTLEAMGMPMSGRLELRATYEDDSRLRGEASMEVVPGTSTLTIESSVPGALVSVGAMAEVMPASFDALVGDRLSVTVQQTQLIAGESYEFGAWSDGGGPSHDVVVDPTDQTLVVELLPERGFVRFEGVSGSYGERSLLLPAGADVIDLRAWVALDDWTPGADQAVLGASGNRLELSVTRTGDLRAKVRTTAGARTATSTERPVVADGERLWLRFELDLDTGEGRFYTSTQSENRVFDVAWTQLGEPIAVEDPAPLFRPIRFLYVGQANQNGIRPFVGKFYEAAVLADGALWARIDFSTTGQLTSSPPDYSRWGAWSLYGPDWTYKESAGS